MGKLKRPQMAVFVKVPGETTPEFCLAGVYTDEMSIAYNPQTEESQDVTETAGRIDITAYSLNVPVTTKVVDKEGAKGYKLSNYIQTLRRNLATTSDAETEALIVDMYEKAKDNNPVAQKFAATIQIDTYGGAATESLGIEYTLNFNGDPVTGSAKITVDSTSGDKKAEFVDNPVSGGIGA